MRRPVNLPGDAGQHEVIASRTAFREIPASAKIVSANGEAIDVLRREERATLRCTVGIKTIPQMW